MIERNHYELFEQTSVDNSPVNENSKIRVGIYISKYYA